MTPTSARSERVSFAIPGVGMGPIRMTSMPMATNPALMACSSIYPDRRVSLPMTARFMWFPLRALRRTCAVAIAIFRAMSAVMGKRFA